MSDCCHDYVILWIESPSLSLLVVGRQHNSTTGRRKGHHTKFKTGGCRALTDYRSHAGPAIRRPEKRHVSSLLREKRQETEYTSACTRILAKGTHNQEKHISTCRGNTYHRNSSGGTDISGGVAGDVFGGTENQREHISPLHRLINIHNQLRIN